jgi:DNA mismatch repair protein MutS2
MPHHVTMAFVPGDFVHVASLGKGTVREVRNGGSYLVEINGRLIVAAADRLSAQQTSSKSARPKKATPARVESPSTDSAAASIDLHGQTVDEALEAVIAFLDRALLSGSPEVRIIHGRSGGRIKAAVHARLRRIGSIRGFRLDPRNPGVTVVEL